VLAAITLFLAFAPQSKPGGAKPAAPEPPWRAEAAATRVVVGTIRADRKALDDAEKSGGAEVAVRIEVSAVLKGEAEKEVAFRFFATPREKVNYPVSPTLAEMRALDGKKQIVYLAQVDDPVARGLWLATTDDGASLREAREADVAAALEQIDRHQRWLKEPVSVADPKIGKEVDALVEELVATPERQTKAQARLTELGAPAVAAIIRAMDDRRPLASPYIALTNKAKDAFEGSRQYSPKLVVDALAAILNQITGERFGFIYNGASGAERAQCAAGWRIYAREIARR
jgi:hypothetical protein